MADGISARHSGGITNRARWIATAGGGVVSGLVSYFTTKVLDRWGVLDRFADSLGDYLKAHVNPGDVGWGLGLILFLAMYGFLIWWMWRPRHIHHLAIQAEARGEARLEMEVLRVPPPPAPQSEPPLNRFFPPTVTQDPELIPLNNAAQKAYSEFRRLFEHIGPSDLWRDPEKALKLTAEVIVDKGNRVLPIWGKYPPSTHIENIPLDDARRFQFSGDATEMFDAIDSKRRWTDLQIAKKDFEQRQIELREAFNNAGIAQPPPPSTRFADKGLKFDYVRKKALLQLHVQKEYGSREARAGHPPHRAYVPFRLVNIHNQALPNCSVVLRKAVKPGKGLSSLLNLASDTVLIGKKGLFDMPKGELGFTLFMRDMSDAITPDPFILRLEEGSFPLDDDTIYEFDLELRSPYPYPTLVKLAVETSKGLDIHVAIKEQRIE